MKNISDILSTPSSAQRTDNTIAMQKAKIPPQAVDMEQAVLGAMMIDKKGVDEVIDMLTPETFYKEGHQYIFQAMTDLFEKSQAIDLLTVSEQLRKNGKMKPVGGEFYLVELTKNIASSAHIEAHARNILDKYLMRSLIRMSSEVLEEAYDETSDIFQVLEDTEKRLYDISQNNTKKGVQSSSHLVSEAKRKIQLMSQKEGVSGVSTGFVKLDELTSGWQPSDLIILAARPGMGKTAMSLSMARNISIDSGMPVAFFSLEMSSVQLITRLISSETGLSSEKLRTGNLADHEWEQLNVKVKSLEDAPLYIDDSAGITIFELRAKARRLASQHGIKLIIIDYLQLMTTGTHKGAGNREQEVSTISRNLKALAKELDIPIIALSQLSRNVETRAGSKRPQLSDLRESGSIEQDADIVSFIFRPEYYKLEVWDDEEQSPTAGQAELIIAKHRNGGLDNVRLRFIAELGKFDNLSVFDQPVSVESKMNTNPNVIDTTQLPPPEDVFDEPDSNQDNNDLPF